jgi:flagellar assembly protein FliH
MPGQGGGDRIKDLQTRLDELESVARRREAEAFEAGVQKGQAAAEEQGSALLESAAAALLRAAEELAGERCRVRREAEEDVVKLAVAIARRILHREMHVDPEALLGVVKAALQKLEARQIERLRVHPTDAGVLREQLARLGLPEKIQIVPDPGLNRGAAVFETQRGNLDASIEVQLQEIQRGLSDRLGASERRP